jgi:predicted nucleotidyltransferase
MTKRTERVRQQAVAVRSQRDQLVTRSRSGHNRTVRLQRGTPVAGIDPETARTIARTCHFDWTSVDTVAERLGQPVEVVVPMLESLADAGYLERQPTRHEPGGTEWTTTVAGGALTMASFLKPISRAKAQQLLAGVLERAESYNADDAKPLLITEIAAFGSYVREAATELGDLDLTVKFERRREEFKDPDVVCAYARASGRTFGTFIDQLAWPEREMLVTLRARSGYINLHTEDVSRFTDEIEVVYRYPAGPTR